MISSCVWLSVSFDTIEEHVFCVWRALPSMPEVGFLKYLALRTSPPFCAFVASSPVQLAAGAGGALGMGKPDVAVALASPIASTTGTTTGQSSPRNFSSVNVICSSPMYSAHMRPLPDASLLLSTKKTTRLNFLAGEGFFSSAARLNVGSVAMGSAALSIVPVTRFPEVWED